jgi:hypothetical protein
MDDATANRIGQVQAVFQQASVSVQTVETDDRGKVAIVFERVNRMVWSWTSFSSCRLGPGARTSSYRTKFVDFAEELRPFGFHGVGDDSNLLLRCCAAIVARDVSPAALVSLNGGMVRDKFPEVVNGVKGAIDFLRQNMHVEALDNLPYSALLVPLAAFFAAPDGKSVKVTGAQKHALVSWFWRACFSRRYSAGVIRNLNRDIGEAIKLRTGGGSDLARFSASIDNDFFLNQTFTVGTVHTNAFVLLLAQLGAAEFRLGITGNPPASSSGLQSKRIPPRLSTGLSQEAATFNAADKPAGQFRIHVKCGQQGSWWRRAERI